MASPAWAEGPRYLEYAVKPAIRLDTQSRLGRPLKGEIVGRSGGGFVLVPTAGRPRDVNWSDLTAADYYGVHKQLIARRKNHRANQWRKVGQYLLRFQNDSKADAYAKKAFDHAIRLNPKLKASIRDLYDARQTVNEATRTAGTKRNASTSSGDAATSSRVELSTPVMVSGSTRHGERFMGRLTAYDSQGFEYLDADHTPRLMLWSDLPPALIFATHTKVFRQRAPENTRGDAPVTLEDWERLADLLGRQPGGESWQNRAMQFTTKLAAEQASQRSESGSDFDLPEDDDDVELGDSSSGGGGGIPTQQTAAADRIPAGFTGQWDIPTEPHVIAQRLQHTYAFGVYRSDDPATFRHEQTPRERIAMHWNEGEAPKFHMGIFPDWWPQPNTTGRLLGILRLRSAGDFLYKHGGRYLLYYVQVAAESDPELGQYLAEAYLRTCPDKAVPAALELLAATYQRNGNTASLNRLLRDGADFKVVSMTVPDVVRGAELFREASVSAREVGKLRRNAQLALLRGDAPAVKAWLGRMDALALNKPQRKQADGLYRQTRRITDGLAAAINRNPKLLPRIDAAIQRIRDTRRLDLKQTPLTQRLADLSDEEVIADLKHAINIFGTHSSPACDRLLYLIEQRQWPGLHITARTLYRMAWHINKYYEPPRAIAVHVLTQKAGVLRPPQKKTWHGDYFAAAECGIYLQRCFEDNQALRNTPEAWNMVRPVIELAARMCNDPTNVTTGHKYAWEHRYMANDALFTFDAFYNRAAPNAVAVFETQLRDMPPAFSRHWVRDHYMKHLYRIEKDYDASLQQIKLMAEGADHIGAREIGVRHLQWWAVKHGRPELWDLADDYARQAQQAARTTVDDPGYRDHLINEHQKYLNKQRPPTLAAAQDQ